jgi:hypothetical protein
MYIYEVWYKPIWGQMTRYCERVKASTAKQAEIKFYATPAGDNCYEIIEITK